MRARKMSQNAQLTAFSNAHNSIYIIAEEFSFGFGEGCTLTRDSAGSCSSRVDPALLEVTQFPAVDILRFLHLYASTNSTITPAVSRLYSCTLERRSIYMLYADKLIMRGSYHILPKDLDTSP